MVELKRTRVCPWVTSVKSLHCSALQFLFVAEEDDLGIELLKILLQVSLFFPHHPASQDFSYYKRESVRRPPKKFLYQQKMFYPIRKS